MSNITIVHEVEVKRLAKDKSEALPTVLELAEADGTIRRYVVNYGKDGASEIAVAVEATGEQKMVLHGKDSGDNIDAFLTDASRRLEVALTGGISSADPSVEHVDPVKIPLTQAAVLTPSSALSSGTANDLYRVTLMVVNIDGGTDVTVSVGIDIDGDGGSLSLEEIFIHSMIVPGPGSLPPVTILLPGNDIIRAEASTADDAAIHWDIVKVA